MGTKSRKKDCRQVITLHISHGYILLHSGACDEASDLPGPGFREPGGIMHPGCVIFDPLPDGAFGAKVNITRVDAFMLSEDARRGIVVPFEITHRTLLTVGSAGQRVAITLDLPSSLYSLYFEVCERSQLYYNFSFVPADAPVEPAYLMDDPWGGVKGKKFGVVQV